MVKIEVPSQLAALAGGRRAIELDADSMAGAFEALDVVAPMLRSQLFDANGRVRDFVAVFLDGVQVLDPLSSSTPVRPGQTLTIMLAVAGG